MQRYLFIYICITIWFRIMFCMFVSSTFLLCGFNIVCKLHHYLIEYEHDTLSIIVRPTIHVLAQVSSKKLLIPVPSEPNVSCLHYIGRDLWPFVDLKLQNLTKKWIAHNKLTSSWNVAAAAKRHGQTRGVAARQIDSVAPFSAIAEGRMIATTNRSSNCIDRDILNACAWHC